MIKYLTMERNKKSIVVLGAGFGGLRTVRRLWSLLGPLPGWSKNARASCEITLIDRNDYQIYTPTLYDIATIPKKYAESIALKHIATLPIEKALSGTNVRFVQDEVLSINETSQFVHLRDNEPIPFDYLVVAMGSEINYFNIPGLDELSIPLKSFKDALRIRDRLTTVFKEHTDPNIVIGGGGSTGIELAGELKNAILKGHWRKLLKGKESIILVEGTAFLLPGFHPKVVKLATNHLEKLGVNILTAKRIASVSKNIITFHDGSTIPFHVLIWTGGVKPSKLTRELNLRTETSGHISTNPDLTCAAAGPLLHITETIYAIGDIVCFRDPKSGKPLPGVVRHAMSEADVVAFNITEEIRQGKIRKAYRPHEWPYLIPVGGKWVIAKVGPIIFAGFGAWILKMLVELNYLISVLPLPLALKQWFKGLLILTKND